MIQFSNSFKTVHEKIFQNDICKDSTYATRICKFQMYFAKSFSSAYVLNSGSSLYSSKLTPLQVAISSNKEHQFFM